MSIWGKPKAKITAEVRLNGHTLELRPNKWNVEDGDHLVIDLDVEIPIRVRDDTTPGVVIQRAIEVIKPEEQA